MARWLSNLEAMKRLKARWGVFLFIGMAVIVIGYLLLGSPISWFVIAGAVFIYQCAILNFDLRTNYSKEQDKILPGFGPGTWLSLLRLLALSLLAGFLVAPRPGEWLAWGPFALYLSFNLIDLIDGYAARRWGQVTLLGTKLDLDLDGRGMLMGSLMAVLIGTAGWWYLLVGLARYLYVFGIWVRKRSSLPVVEKPNPRGRPLAGLQMGVTVALLAPTLHPPFTIWISTLVMIPFLINFLYDWLVIGRKRAKQVVFPDWVKKSLPLILRAVLVALLAYRLVSTETIGASLAIGVLIIIGLLLGAGVRVLCLMLLIQIGLVLQTQQPQPMDLFISLCSLALVYLGPGALSAWQPENPILRKRLGEHGKQTPSPLRRHSLVAAAAAHSGQALPLGKGKGKK